jgi:amino acid adenylation domain-containing protein
MSGVENLAIRTTALHGLEERHPRDPGSRGWNIHQQIEARAARRPEASAIVHEDERMSYGELNARANRLARHLARLGVGPEVRVAICLERGPEMIVSLLAVLKAGGAYVPLDPGYPPERLRFMLADSGVAVLLSRDAVLGLLDVPGDVRVVDVEREREAWAAESAENPGRTAPADGLAYVIYTSGSTGTPKGVMVSHHNLTRSTAARLHFYPEPVGAYLLLSSIAFDSSVAGIFWTLSEGGALVLPGADEMGDADRLRSLVDRAGVTHLLAVPSLYTQLLDTRASWGGSLRTVIVAGEACTPQLAKRHRARLAETALVNEYGPTEATVWCSAHLCGDETADGPVPIGRATAGTRLHLLDGALHAAPRDGELFVGGVQVARGYLGRPALTAERFLPDPRGAEPGARMYRTGDRVRRRADGALEFLGRLDEQVKIRGFRVELGEIESALRRCEGVGDCAVVAREDASGEVGLVAYLTGAARADALRAALRRHLPEAMVPAAFVRLERLPLTPNGKLDRKALPAPPSAAEEEGYAAPRTATERALARIWCEVLGVEAVGIDRPFLELGGHSLRAMRMLARIAGEFGVRIPPHVLLRSGTIAEVAARVDAPRDAGEAEAPLVPVPRDRPLPLSYSQEATWFFEHFAPGLMAYRAQSTIRMRGALDIPVLERAVTEIVRRHEILRTTFPVENGAPVQRIHAPWTATLPVHDVSEIPAAEREAAAAGIIQGEFLKPFDTAALPLVWLSLVRLAPAEHVFVMVEHHFVHDGWSAGVFLRELRALYLAYRDGKDSPLPPLPVQFADFAVWQRRWVETTAGQDGLRFWERELAGVPPLALPTDFPRPATMRFRGARERVRLAPALAAETRAFSREQGVTFFVTLLAAFQALLGRYSGQADFCVGSGLGNRGRVELEEVIGMVVNTVAFRADLGGDPTAAALLRRVRDVTLRAYEHQDVPFDQVVRRIQPERTSNALPLYQVSFSFHDSHMPGLSFGGLELELEEAQNNGSSKFDLQVIVIPRAEQGDAAREGEVVMVWEYNTDLFEGATVRRMIRHFETLLERMVRGPECRVSSLELLEDGERRQVVEGWSAAADDAVPFVPVHARIAAQAVRTPDAVAIVDGGRVLSYRALDEHANRLARVLRRRGVGPESRVGVCLERGAELIVARLAVLRAGAAYVALDPAYPPERLALMLADSGAEALVTRDALRGLFPADGTAQVVAIEGAAGEIDAEDSAPLEVPVDPAGLAYVVYTSGSTGTPKGVAVEHAALDSLCAWHARAFGVTAADRATQLASPGFDAWGWEVWPYLAAGARVEVVPDEARTDAESLRDWLVRAGSTVAFVPTPVAEPLLALPWPAETPLRWLLAGGDRLRVRPGAALPFSVSNNYGPTECTVVATSGTVGAGGSRAPSIGRPIDRTSAYVLDAAMQPAPAGVPGELYLGGAQVARGYLGRPALTAERFLPDPFSARPGARLYRTGDRARWRADGALAYEGRVDEQVKIRGFRIEPGEIEAVLRGHPAVRDCAVVVRGGGAGERRLAAYVAADADPALAAALRALLRGKLPEYMVPATLTVLDALPLTAHGKLDRRALPAPAEDATAGAGYVAPSTEAERGIARIWQELLGRERMGVQDDFFAAGGDSLLATRVVLRTRELLGREVPLASLFDHRTLAAFALVAESAEPRQAPARGLVAGSAQRRAAARAGAVRP